MKTKHTPGPWELMPETSFRSPSGAKTIPLVPIANCSDAFSNEVALVWKSTAFANRDAANAQLIAAAPDLLAACETILHDPDLKSTFETATHRPGIYADKDISAFNEWCERTAAIYAQLQAAVAKVRGAQ